MMGDNTDNDVISPLKCMLALCQLSFLSESQSNIEHGVVCVWSSDGTFVLPPFLGLGSHLVAALCKGNFSL